MSKIIWHREDFGKLATWLIPTFLRRLYFVEFVKILVSEVGFLHDSILYKMQHDCRVIYLEKMLNEGLGVLGYNPLLHEATKAIYIEDEVFFPEKYSFQEMESDESTTAFLESEAVEYMDENSNSVQFIVFAPSILNSLEVKIKSLLDYYKLAGKRYKIQYY